MLRMFLKLVFVSVMVLMMSACDNGGGGDTPSVDINTTQSVINLTGQVNAKFIESSSVSLYISSDLENPIISTKILETGNFEMKNISIDKNELYIVTACLGEEKQECINTLAKGQSLINTSIKVGYVSDMIYMSLNDSFRENNLNTTEAFLNKKAIEYLNEDINNDGDINYNDILIFNPKIHSSKLNINYTDIDNLYTQSIENNLTKIDKLKLLLSLDKPIIILDEGNQLTTPATVNIQIKNLPNDVNYTLNVNNKPISNPYSILENGIYQIYGNILFNNEIIGEVTKEIVASNKISIGQINIDVNKDNSLSIGYDENNSFSGLEINIPKMALSNSSIITVQENNLSVIASSRGRTLSSVLSLEPSGTKFDKPVMIKIPFTGNLESSEIEKVEIARYSKDSGLDYIKPLYVDVENKFIYFETDHFSWFSAKGPFASKTSSQREEEINYLNNLTGNSWSEKRWKTILEPDNIKEYTLYDYFYELYLSEKIYNKVEDSDFVGATKVLFPNNDGLDDTVERWDNVMYGLKALQVFMSKGAKIYNFSTNDTLWWAFWTKGHTGQLYTMMGLSQDYALDKENIAYTPFAPVKLGNKIFKKFSKLLQNNVISKAFAMAEIDGGWNDVYIKPNINSPDTENSSNQNIGVVYRRYDEFRKHGAKNKESLKSLVEKRATFVDNMENPYLSVYVDRVDGHRYQQFGDPIEVEFPKSINIDTRIYGLGIANFDESDLKYELIGNYGQANQFILNQDTSKNGLYFKLPDEEMYQNYVLKITHTPTSISYEEHGINIKTKQGNFRLHTSSLMTDKALYPDDKIILIFDENIDIDTIDNAIYFKNSVTSEKVNATWKFKSICVPSLEEADSSGRVPSICSDNKKVLIISQPIDNNKYRLVIDNTLQSETGKVLEIQKIFNIDKQVAPKEFIVIYKGIEYNNDRTSAKINFYIKNTDILQKVFYDYSYYNSGGSGNLRSSGGCPVAYPDVNICGGFVNDKHYEDQLSWTIDNSTNQSIDSNFILKLCNQENNCINFSYNILLAKSVRVWELPDVGPNIPDESLGET